MQGGREGRRRREGRGRQTERGGRERETKNDSKLVNEEKGRVAAKKRGRDEKTREWKL